MIGETVMPGKSIQLYVYFGNSPATGVSIIG